MNKLSILMASAAFVLAGCGDKEQTVTPETIDQAAEATGTEVAALVEQGQPAEAADSTAAVATEPSDTAPATAGTATEETVAAAAATVAAVKEEVAQEVAAASATVAAAAGQAAAVTAAQPDLAQGKQIYSKNCFACHGSGAAGAPKLGDTGNWAPRITQGMDTLTEHAIKGFKGAAGYMPPKGGFMTLSDADVTAAVAYMVSESR